MKIPDIILDTTPLFDFLMWRFTEQSPSIETVSYPFPCLRTVVAREAFAELRIEARTLTTVPGVFAEIHRHALRSLGSKVADFWVFTREEVFRMDMGEHLVKFLDLSVETLKALGPVDASLIELARSWPGRPEEVGILGDDRGLERLCLMERVTYLWAGDLPSLIGL